MVALFSGNPFKYPFTGYFALSETISGIARRFYLLHKKIYLYKMEYGRYRASIQPFRHPHRSTSRAYFMPDPFATFLHRSSLHCRFRDSLPGSAMLLLSEQSRRDHNNLRPRSLTISVKVKTVVRTRGLALVASGQNSFAIQCARRTQCDERHDPGTWQAGERNSTLSVTVQAFGTYLPHGWLFDDSP